LSADVDDEGRGAALALPPFDDACILRALPLARAVSAGPLLFRGEEEGFLVEELPAYLPGGTGEHLYLFIEKRGLSTPGLVKRLERRFGLAERDIGYAGRKDERGITRQWLSVPARKVEPELAAVEELGVRLLEARRHGNKLRLGHLRGNRFTIHLDAAAGAGAVDRDALAGRALLVAEGVPNLFGAQRFGIGGGADGTPAPDPPLPSLRRPARGRREEFLVSAAQASLFNAWLADRIDDGTWQAPLLGDVLEKVPTGAPFLCDDPAADAPRLQRGEVCVSGPLVGRAMRPAERDAMTRESRSWEQRGIAIGDLLGHPAFAGGARRPAAIRPADLEIEVAAPQTPPASSPAGLENPRITVRFSLPKGAYASVVLRALLGPSLVDAAFLDGPADLSPPRRG
jgi:tRNA pseudouridine13 synthase